MTTYGTYWKLRITDFDRHKPGFFVSALARRSDFDIMHFQGMSGQSFVFPDFEAAATAGQAVFRALARPRDILIISPDAVGEVVDGPADLMQEGRDIVDREPWRKFLANFARWEFSGDPKNYTRQEYIATVARISDDDLTWTYVQHQERGW